MSGQRCTELEFLNNPWGLGTEQEYGYRTGARQATKAGGINSLDSIPGLLKSKKFGLCTPLTSPPPSTYKLAFKHQLADFF